MKLIKIEIRQMPGLTKNLIIDPFHPNLSLIVGPNAVGKSSVFRALKYLLQPAVPSDPKLLTLFAEFEDPKGDILKVSRVGSEIVWECNGEIASRPNFAIGSELDYYFLVIHSLMRAGDKEENLEKELKKTLHGGFDLDSLAVNLQTQLNSRKDSIARNKLNANKSHLEQIEKEYIDLEREEQKITELQSNIRVAEKAIEQSIILEQAITYAEARNEYLVLENELKRYPEQFSLMTGKELTDINQLEVQKAQLEKEFEKIGIQISFKEKDIQQLNLKNYSEINSLQLKQLRQKLVDLEKIEIEIENTEKELSKAETLEKIGLENLGGESVHPKLNQEILKQSEKLALDNFELEKKQIELKSRISLLASAPDKKHLEKVESAIQSLQRWLAVSEPVYKLSYLFLSFIFLGGVYLSYASYLAETVMFGMGIAFSVVSLLLFYLLGAYNQQKCKKQYLSTGFTPPQEWNNSIVAPFLESLQTQYLQLLEDERQGVQSQVLKSDLHRIEHDIQKLDKVKQTFCERNGFDPNLTMLGVDRFVRLIDQFEKAKAEKIYLISEISRLTNKKNIIATEINSFLNLFGNESDTVDSKQLFLAFENIESRFEKRPVLKNEIDLLHAQLKSLGAKQLELSKKIESILIESGFSFSGKKDLEKVMHMYPEWQEKTRLALAKKSNLEYRLEPIKDCYELIAQVQTGFIDVIKNQYKDLKSEGEKLIAYKEEIAAIERSLRDAGKNHKLASAQLELEKSLQDIDDLHETFIENFTEKYLLDSVKEEYKFEFQPRILKSARERFLGFTHHEFDLVYDENKGFVCKRLNDNATLQLDQLSLGTRMQVLLALRTSWINEVETKCLFLPLFFDEALSTSDESRFLTIAENLYELCNKEGRQMLYLTARYQEIPIWSQAWNQQLEVIDLIKMKQADAEEFHMESLPIFQRSHEVDLEEYKKRLSVKKISELDFTRLHIYYIMSDDLERMHDLIEHLKVKEVGQLEALLNSSRGEKLFSSTEVLKKYKNRIKLARHWFSYWSVGRVKSLSKAVLEESGFVSQKFIDEVSKIMEESNGDSALLIEKLNNKAVAGFGGKRINDLEDWFKMNGYVDTRTPIPKDERIQKSIVGALDYIELQDAKLIIHSLEKGASLSQKGGMNA